MNELTLTTPALLFSAISLIMFSIHKSIFGICCCHKKLARHLSEKTRSNPTLSDSESKNKINTHSLDADFWHCKFITLRVDYVSYLHKFINDCSLGFWHSFITVDFVSRFSYLGNTNLIRST